jgi:hypothetical protein
MRGRLGEIPARHGQESRGMSQNTSLTTQLELLPALKLAPAPTSLRAPREPCGHVFQAQPTPSVVRRHDRRSEAKRSIDELVTEARLYRSSKAFHEMIDFVSSFRHYSPFNAMLVHHQKPGTQFIAPASRWRALYGRSIKPGARPLVILRPMGPVMFVFDVADTEPLPGARPLPADVERPFETSLQLPEKIWARTLDNIKRDGVRVTMAPQGTHLAGRVVQQTDGPPLEFVTKRRPRASISVPTSFEITINDSHDLATRYATLSHELGHLYCGHLGTPNEKWWPNRQDGDHRTREFEAEVVSYIACKRIDPNTKFPPYLTQHLGDDYELPPISLERIMHAAGDIVQAGTTYLKPRVVAPAKTGQST